MVAQGLIRVIEYFKPHCETKIFIKVYNRTIGNGFATLPLNINDKEFLNQERVLQYIRDSIYEWHEVGNTGFKYAVIYPMNEQPKKVWESENDLLFQF